jgi:hypothetical protein
MTDTDAPEEEGVYEIVLGGWIPGARRRDTAYRVQQFDTLDEALGGARAGRVLGSLRRSSRSQRR